MKKMMIHWNKSWHEFPFQLTPPSDWQKIQLLYEEFHVTITIDAKRFSLIISSALLFSVLHRAVNWNSYFFVGFNLVSFATVKCPKFHFVWHFGCSCMKGIELDSYNFMFRKRGNSPFYKSTFTFFKSQNSKIPVSI